MNPLTSILLIANPLVTALLAAVVFLESRKQRNLLVAVEKAVTQSSRNVIEAVERQKEGFDAIAKSLKSISEDQGRSVETFTGISNALSTTSITNEQSLKNVVGALDAATLKTEATMAGLSQLIEKSNIDLKEGLKTAYGEASTAITSVGDKIGDEYTKLADRLFVLQKNTTDAFEKTITSQGELNAGLAKSLGEDTKAVKQVIEEATSKTGVTILGLNQTIEKSNNDLKQNLKTAYGEASTAITSVGDKIGDEYTKLADRLLIHEKNTTNAFEKTITSQKELNAGLAKSLGEDTKAVKQVIEEATSKTGVTILGLNQTIEKSNNDLKQNLKTAYGEASTAITSVGDKIGDEYTKLADRLSVHEKNTADAFEKAVTSQQSLNASLAKSINEDTKSLKEGIAANSNELAAIESTLKKAVSI